MKLASRDYVFSFRMMEGEGGHSYPYRLRLRKHCELLMSSLNTVKPHLSSCSRGSVFEAAEVGQLLNQGVLNLISNKRGRQLAAALHIQLVV